MSGLHSSWTGRDSRGIRTSSLGNRKLGCRPTMASVTQAREER